MSVTYNKKSNWELNERVINTDINKWENGINDCATEINRHQSSSDHDAHNLPIILQNQTMRFCTNSGNVDVSGDADLLSYSGSTLSFKTGGSYTDTLITYADKTQEVLTSLASITGMSTNGVYTVLKEKGSNPVAVLSTTVTQGKTFPTSPTNGDYHCLTATGLQTYKRVSGAWVGTQYVPLGTATVAGGVISAVSTNGYNRNGYDTAEVSFQSNKYIDLTLGASGATYTAPADGYYILNKSATGSNDNIYMVNNSNGYARKYFSAAAGHVWCDIPVKKGDVINIQYTTPGTTNVFRFYYNEGSKP